MPRVWNSNTEPDYPADAVYVGRGSPWGNPFKRGLHGNRDEVCDRFEAEVLPELDVSELVGKGLVCFCAPKRCHADALLRKANAALDLRPGMAFRNPLYDRFYYVGTNGDGERVFDFGDRKSGRYSTFGGVDGHLHANLERLPEEDRIQE